MAGLRLRPVRGIAFVVAMLALAAAWARGSGSYPDTDAATIASTIDGVVRGPAGTSPVEGRPVEAINLETGARRQTMTTSNGVFSFRLPPGKYRVQVTLLPGESMIREPGVIDLNRAPRKANAEFRLVPRRTSHPRPTPSVAETGLGPPIA
jgi:hypothetical protein